MKLVTKLSTVTISSRRNLKNETLNSHITRVHQNQSVAEVNLLNSNWMCNPNIQAKGESYNKTVNFPILQTTLYNKEEFLENFRYTFRGYEKKTPRRRYQRIRHSSSLGVRSISY